MSFKRVRDDERSPVKTVVEVPPTGTVRGFSRATINEMDRTDRASLRNDDLMLAKDGSDEFLSLAKALTQLTDYTPVVNLPSYIIAEKQHKNKIILAASASSASRFVCISDKHTRYCFDIPRNDLICRPA